MDDKAIKRSYRKLFDSNPEYYGKMLKVFDKSACHISCQDSPELLVYPFFCQLWSGYEDTLIEENLICASLWQLILAGKIQYVLQQTPRCFQDHEIKENQSLFKSYKISCIDHRVKEADFWGGKNGEDGFIEFEEPLIKNQTYFPLEVGYVRPTQVAYHLTHRKCIARIPYESDYIVYFESVA